MANVARQNFTRVWSLLSSIFSALGMSTITEVRRQSDRARGRKRGVLLTSSTLRTFRIRLGKGQRSHGFALLHRAIYWDLSRLVGWLKSNVAQWRHSVTSCELSSRCRV